MKVKRMIEELKKMNPEDDVRFHHPNGDSVLFVLKVINIPEYGNVVFLRGKDNINMAVELAAQFEHAAETQMDELDFFMDLMDMGFTLEDIQKFLPEKYEYSKKFMEEHGLI